MRKVVFFDRDGTLIYDKIYLNDPEQIEYLPGVFEGMLKLQEKGFEFIVVTNQSGVPRGLVDPKVLEEIHKIIRQNLKDKGIEVLKFYHAPYLVESNHHWRKPNPGMLEAGINEYNVDPAMSWMVGDRMTDVEAGRRGQMRTVFLHGTEAPEESEFAPAYCVAKDFPEVCELILKNS